MAPIVESVEIARRPEDVFAYVTDVGRLAEWQEGLVSASRDGDGPAAVGSKIAMTRRVGGRERTMTMEITDVTPPTSWGARGIDGPVRATVTGTIEPLEDGARSRLTVRLEFAGHGIGKLLVPFVVRPQARAELPRDQQTLKRLLESGG
jgi:uncharacterized protein YndB with AHSA1/START domain